MSELAYGLTSTELFRRAGILAQERYPDGCANAEKLADIVREVIADAKNVAEGGVEETDKVLFVCVEADEDTYFYIADQAKVEEYYEEYPDADGHRVALAVGRPATEEELSSFAFSIQGVIAY